MATYISYKREALSLQLSGLPTILVIFLVIEAEMDLLTFLLGPSPTRRTRHLNKHILRRVAIQEVLNPSLTLTRQFLAVNKVIFKEGVPFIEDIILDPEENLARVYFPIEGEQYYLVVTLVPEPNPIIRGIAISPGNEVYFAVKSETHSPEELLTLAAIEPTRTWRRGERNGKLPLHNGFEIRFSEKKTGDVEDKLRSLLDTLLLFRTDLSHLSPIASAGIYIVYYGYKEQMGGIHLDEEMIGKLAELHVPVDIDLYASGPDLDPLE